jgi:hypothetical protein
MSAWQKKPAREYRAIKMLQGRFAPGRSKEIGGEPGQKKEGTMRQRRCFHDGLLRAWRGPVDVRVSGS